nr:MAG TPA: hypothetical protein [Caudoviricetes sp.]
MSSLSYLRTRLELALSENELISSYSLIDAYH